MAKGKDPKPSHQLYKLQIKSTGSTRQTVCGIYKRALRAPTKENALVLIVVDLGGKNKRSRTRLESELPYSRSRDQHSVGGRPRKVRWTVTPREGKDSDSNDSRKTFIIVLTCSVDSFGFFSFFLFRPPLL